jgi:hypothetical protein
MTPCAKHRFVWTIYRRLVAPNQYQIVRDARVCEVCGEERESGTTAPDETLRSARYVTVHGSVTIEGPLAEPPATARTEE